MWIQPYWLGAFYALSEVGISIFLRSRNPSKTTDRGSLRLIWTIVMLCVTASIGLSIWLPVGRISVGLAAYRCGVVLYAASLVLRWYSIYYLGRFFTVDVTVVADQTVIDTGPYRYVRHPSYLGAIGAFVGLGLCMNNWVSWLILVAPITAVFLFRIKVEETVLQQGLGDAYAHYMTRTYRLLPWVY